MEKTGISMPHTLSLLAIILPLIPLLIISLRRTWKLDLMIYLGMICLLSFVHHMMVYIPTLISANTLFINSVFELSELAVMLYMFKQVIEPGWVKQAVNTILISFTSVAITIYALRGIEAHAYKLAMISAVILLPTALLALLQLISNKQLFIFQSPLFWIAGGNICYYSMFILIGLVGMKGKHSIAFEQEQMILLSVINGIRFLFFIVATCTVARQEESVNGY